VVVVRLVVRWRREMKAMATLDHRLEQIAANPLKADVRLAHVSDASPSACNVSLWAEYSQLNRR